MPSNPDDLRPASMTPRALHLDSGCSTIWVMALASERCVACRPGAPMVMAEEEATLLGEIPDWRIVEQGGIRRLERVFRFADFAHALTFTNTIGAIAEAEGHHPALTTEWGRVTVQWWTHAIGGLHRNDFVMAAKTDERVPGR